MIAAVGVSGCGRKAGLDPPPASTLVDPSAAALEPGAAATLEPVAVEPVAVAPRAPGAPLNLDGLALQTGTPLSDRALPPPPPPPARSLTFLPETAPRPQASPVYGPDGKPVIPKPPEKKWFILDWLID